MTTDVDPGKPVPLHCREVARVGPRRFEPVTCGIPWPREMLRDPARLAIGDGATQSRPLQARVLGYWPDGSIRWTLLDWLASVEEGSCNYALRPTVDGGPREQRPTLVESAPSDKSVLVNTGSARFSLRAGQDFPFADVRVHGLPALDIGRCNLVAHDVDGEQLVLQITDVVVEQEGPVRTVVRLAGLLGKVPGKPILEIFSDLHFYVGSPTVRCDLTVRNPRRAVHRGGIWTLGDAGSVYLSDLSVTLAIPRGAGATEIYCSPELGMPYERCDGPVELYQDSSGGDNWDSPNHVDRSGRIPVRFRGYRFLAGTRERRGHRATPIMALHGPDHFLGVAVPEFWQNFPKAIEVSDQTITVSLFPEQFAAEHEIQGGEQKTHSFFVACGHDHVTDIPLAWCRSRLVVSADPECYAAAQAVPHLTPACRDRNTGYLRLVDAAITGDDAFQDKRETIDEFGWRHFGDLHADHEALFHKGSVPLISHYNNQYDVVGGTAIQFLRSADARWYRLMDELAHHVIDIDIYHTDEDKSAYNNGFFWHTHHYVDAGASTHRSFPNAAGVAGGGPSAEHLYTTGLMLHYLLTGSPLSRDAVVRLGQYVIDADDGNKAIFRFLCRGYTGLASMSGSDTYHGPGRGPGNAINALLDAHRLSGEARFLDKAEQLVRRCIHPCDDIPARNLLHAETRWFYTVFLQSLGKYLAYKSELGALDEMYAYAHGALLHYARWAATHEYPYLDKPEKLDFPTETWAAQDMRKSEVFKIAAKLTAGEERALFLTKARSFFDCAVDELTIMATRTRTRPVALMLSYGYSQAYFDADSRDVLPPPSLNAPDFGAPEQFVGQKRRAISRVKRTALFCVSLLILAALAMLM